MVVPERVPISMIDYDRISQKSSLGRDENSDSKVEMSRRKTIWTQVQKHDICHPPPSKPHQPPPSTITTINHHHQPTPLLTQTLPPTLHQPPSTTTPRKNDASGRYLRKWLPELQKLDAKYVHEPWAMSEDLMSRCTSAHWRCFWKGWKEVGGSLSWWSRVLRDPWVGWIFFWNGHINVGRYSSWYRKMKVNFGMS